MESSDLDKIKSWNPENDLFVLLFGAFLMVGAEDSESLARRFLLGHMFVKRRFLSLVTLNNPNYLVLPYNSIIKSL